VSRTRLVAGLALAVVAVVPGVRALGIARVRTLRARVQALEAERKGLRERVEVLMASDARLHGMPEAPLRVGVPASLLSDVLGRIASGVLDQVQLQLADLHVHKSGEVRKLVSVGSYHLDVTVLSLQAQLRAGRPQLRFGGGDQVTLRLPVTIESGAGRANLHFVWRGKNLSGALCGDLDVRQPVSAAVRTRRYLLQASLALQATSESIVASPRLPVTTVKVPIEPSPESWRAVDAILARKKGACGLVLDAIDVPGLLRDVLHRGIAVRLPTEKVPTLRLPIGIEPTLEVRSRPLALAIRVGQLAVTPHDLWLGASVSLRPPQVGASASPVEGGTGAGMMRGEADHSAPPRRR
jgi:hypothetical protein